MTNQNFRKDILAIPLRMDVMSENEWKQEFERFKEAIRKYWLSRPKES